MTDKWLTKPCGKCGSEVAYLAEWKQPPKLCDRCRLEGQDIRWLLEWFLRRHNRGELDDRPPKDKEFAERMAVQGGKVRRVLAECPDSKALREACLADRELIRLALRMAKERRFEEAPRREGKGFLPKRAATFLQGGAPGLGKKS